MGRRVIRRRASHIPTAEELIAADEPREKRFKKAMTLAKSPGIELDDEMRHDLATMIPGVNEGSWKKLGVEELDRLLDMLEGYIYITYLKSERGDYR